MKKFATVALIPLCAGFLWAQVERQTTTTSQTTTANWNGTLVDAACQSSHTEHRQTTTATPGQTTTTTTESREYDCPVTTTTTTFGLMTPEGQYVRFDEPSNTRIVEVVRGNKYHTYVTERKPIKVHIKGKKHGDVVVMETIK